MPFLPSKSNKQRSKRDEVLANSIPRDNLHGADLSRAAGLPDCVRGWAMSETLDELEAIEAPN